LDADGLRGDCERATGKGDRVRSAGVSRLVTAQTQADLQALTSLEKPGTVIFRDNFESLKKYFEIRGLSDRRAELVTDANLAHSGEGVIRFTAPARQGRESGAGASG
jgi:hypothetical protein